jgi:large subunit ribosomal protein L20
MPRTTDTHKHHAKRRKILKQTKGYWGRRSKLYRTAKDALAKAGMYAYRDRRRRKGEFRRLWIARISAACRQHDLKYSQFIHGLDRAGITLNRKALSNLAIEDPAAFEAIVKRARAELAAADS